MRIDKDINQQVQLTVTLSSELLLQINKTFQKFSTTVDEVNLHDEKFDIILGPLIQSWYISTNNHHNVSLSGFTITLKRSPTPYLTNTYLPTSLLALGSLIGFLIPVEMVPGRMALLVTIFLTLENIRSTEKRTGPTVSTGEIFFKIE